MLLADDRSQLAAPLFLTWGAIVVPIHLHVGAMLKEILCFITGIHLAAVDTAVTCERGTARLDIDVGDISNLGFSA